LPPAVTYGTINPKPANSNEDNYNPRLVSYLRNASIQFRAQDVLPSDAGSAFLSAIESACDQIANGALVTIDPKAHRVTLLPITR
jgi:hypothetical protein